MKDALKILAGLLAGLAGFSVLVASVARGADRPGLLFFTSPTCGPCQLMHPVIDQLRSEGYAIVTYEPESDRMMFDHYRVTRTPTLLVIDQLGKERHRYVGIVSAEQIRGMARGGPAGAPASSSEQIAWSPRGWDVLVEVPIGNAIDWGSGTVVAGQDGRSIVLTNHHVIRDALAGDHQRSDIWVRTKPRGRLRARVLGFDEANDVALIEVATSLPVVALATSEAAIGTRVQLAGFEFGKRFTGRIGQVVGLTDSPAGGQTDIPSIDGQSGGAVYSAGHLVGVIYGGHAHAHYTGIGPVRRLMQCVLGTTNYVAPAGGNRPVLRDPRDTQTTSCGCREHFRAIEQRLAIVEQTARTPGPAGPRGPAGPVGSPGQDVTIDEAALVTQVTQAVLAQIQLPESPDSQKYYVLVASDEASYWPRLGGELAAAQEAYSHIRLAPPPNYSVGPLPQLVEYQAGKPLRSIAGSHEVSSALSHLARGETP